MNRNNTDVNNPQYMLYIHRSTILVCSIYKTRMQQLIITTMPCYLHAFLPFTSKLNAKLLS